MINYESKRETDKLIKDIMRENSISLDNVLNCFEQHKDEINEMNSIFYLVGERSKQLAIGSIGLLAREQADTFTEYYRREFKLSKSLNGLSKEDITLLVTACIYKPAFFSLPLSICDNIQSKLFGATKPHIDNWPVNGIDDGLDDSAFIVVAASEDNMLDITLFTASQKKLFKPSSRLLNIAEKYICIAFQAEGILEDLKNYSVEISKDGHTQLFPLPPPGDKNFYRANELIIKVDVTAWQGPFEGATIKFVEKPKEA